MFIEEKKKLRLLEKLGWQQIQTHSVELGKKRRALQTSLDKMANLEEVLSDTSQQISNEKKLQVSLEIEIADLEKKSLEKTGPDCLLAQALLSAIPAGEIPPPLRESEEWKLAWSSLEKASSAVQSVLLAFSVSRSCVPAQTPNVRAEVSPPSGNATPTGDFVMEMSKWMLRVSPWPHPMPLLGVCRLMVSVVRWLLKMLKQIH